MKKIALALVILPWMCWSQSSLATLTLGEYLKAFREKNESYLALDEKIKAAALDASKANLFTSTDLIGQAQYAVDEKLPSIPFFNYGALTTWNSAIGIENTAPFGLRTRFTYEVDRYRYKDLLLDPSLGNQNISLMDARPVLALEQPLWKDGFGKKITLQKRQATAAANGVRIALEAQREQMEIFAEQTYHRLSALRDYLKTHELAKTQTESMYAYIQKRVRMNLMDRAELYQAQAQLELEALEIQSAQKEIATVENELNLYRGSPPGTPVPPVDELVTTVDEASLAKLEGVSLEYISAKNQTDLEKIQGGLSRNDTLPTLNLRSTFALNGRDDDLASVMGDSFSSDRTTLTIGLMLRVPLDARTHSNIRQSAGLSIHAAEKMQRHIAQKNLTDQAIILEQAREAARRLVLSQTIAQTQRKKLDLEKVRLRQGRTTTYQVLLFERDLLLSDLRAIQAKLDWSVLKTELRRFNHGPEGNPS